MSDEKEEATLNFDEVFTESVEPYYHDAGLITPPFRLYRLNSPRGRAYFRFRDEENHKDPVIYLGTGAITSQIPIGRSLQRYREKLGTIAADHELFMWSLYGSFSDTVIANFIREGRLENGLDGLVPKLRDYYYFQRFFVEEYEFSHLAKCIKKDMIGFERFVYDRKAEFVFVQYPVTSEIDGTATPLDIGAFLDVEVPVDGYKKNGELKIRKDKEIKRVFGLINYKSGKIYPSHGIQCKGELTMFKESHPEFTAHDIRVFNLTIRDYKSTNWDRGTTSASDYGKPYELKDWTNAVSDDEYFHYLQLAKMKRTKIITQKISVISGDLKIGEEPSRYITTKTIQEMIEDGSWQRFEKSSASIPEELLIQQ